MGDGGKLEEQAKARELRAQGLTLLDIATALGVSKSSVSVWVRDVEFTPSPRRTGAQPSSAPGLRRAPPPDRGAERRGHRPHRCARRRILPRGRVALYAGEGAKRDREVKFANTDPAMVRFFCAWLRRFFAIDEGRLRVRVYLHEGLDLDAAQAFWSEVAGIPVAQLRAPYRAAADPTIRSNRHVHGCVYVLYSCSETHRRIMGLVRALLSCGAIPG